MNTVTERLPLIQLPIGTQKRQLGRIEVCPGGQKKQLPLAGVETRAVVADRVASVTVRQKFRNTFTEHLEAVYIFPLSGGCTVSAFELRVGNRVVKGLVQERAAARQQYQQAIQSGKRAALLEQERDDVFTMQVGNIPPGEEVSVQLTYCERLSSFEDGRCELRLPLVVGQRYIPGDPAARPSVGDGTASDTNAVPDASRITPPLLADGFDPQVHLKLTVELLPAASDSVQTVEDLCCAQHATKLSLSNGGLQIDLARTDERLDRDFVLQWRLAGTSLKSSLVVHKGEDGQYGMLSIVPPKRDGYLGAARDVVFLVDRSGSMMGIKMVSAVRACSLLLNTLGPQDRFAIASFDNYTEWMQADADGSGNVFAAGDEAGIERGERFLRSINARGGTELFGAVQDCFNKLDTRSLRQGRISVLVVLTDGEVGDEARILRSIQTLAGDTRIFTVGIDTAVNSGLLKRMASVGGGTCAFVAPGADLETTLQAIGREIGQPLVTDLTVAGVNGDTIEAGTLAPARIPDLFAGRPSTAFFKISGKGSIRVQGRFADGTAFEEKVKIAPVNMPAIAQLWAKAHITELEDQYRIQPTEALRQQIISVSVKHSVLCKQTAFVAVDETEVVNPDGTVRRVVQPVEKPAGWDMLADSKAKPAAKPRMMADSSYPAPQAPSCDMKADAGFVAEPQTDVTRLLAPGSALRESLLRPLGLHSDESDTLMSLPAQENKPATASDVNRIRKALANLKEALEKAYSMLKDGNSPTACDLKAARAALMNLLTASELAAELPELQRFLRAAAVELIDSLEQHGCTVSALMPLWQRHMKAFDQAYAEANNRLAGTAGSGGNFWEASI